MGFRGTPNRWAILFPRRIHCVGALLWHGLSARCADRPARKLLRPPDIRRGVCLFDEGGGDVAEFAVGV